MSCERDEQRSSANHYLSSQVMMIEELSRLVRKDIKDEVRMVTGKLDALMQFLGYHDEVGDTGSSKGVKCRAISHDEVGSLSELLREVGNVKQRPAGDEVESPPRPPSGLVAYERQQSKDQPHSLVGSNRPGNLSGSLVLMPRDASILDLDEVPNPPGCVSEAPQQPDRRTQQSMQSVETSSWFAASGSAAFASCGSMDDFKVLSYSGSQGSEVPTRGSGSGTTVGTHKSTNVTAYSSGQEKVVPMSLMNRRGSRTSNDLMIPQPSHTGSKGLFKTGTRSSGELMTPQASMQSSRAADLFRKQQTFVHGSGGSRRSDFDNSRAQWKGAAPGWLKEFVTSDYFDSGMGVILLLNAVSIGFQVNHMAGQSDLAAGDYHQTLFRVMDGFFCICFTSELSARLGCFGMSMYSNRGKWWNIFDTVIVVFQLLDEFTKLVLPEDSDISGFIKNIGVLRLLRLAKILRLVRMVRLINELRSMVYLIMASMWSFFWTLTLLTLMMFCVAVYFTEIAGDLARDWDLEGDTTSSKQVRASWGSVSRSMLSLFQAITGGEDWAKFIYVFGEGHVYIINTLIFSVYIAFATLVMLNLVTGVFVEGAQRIIREDKDNDLVRQVCKMFTEADDNNDHAITLDEFNEQIDSPHMVAYFQSVDLDKNQAGDLFQLLDTDGSGTLTVEEFVRGCMRLKGPARSVDMSTVVTTCFEVEEKLSELVKNTELHQSEMSESITSLFLKVDAMQPRPQQRDKKDLFKKVDDKRGKAVVESLVTDYDARDERAAAEGNRNPRVLHESLSVNLSMPPVRDGWHAEDVHD